MIIKTITKDISFASTILQNGVGRYVPQLQRVTIKFCKEHGGSKGVREFIESELVNFASRNPATVIYVKPRRHRSSVAVAEFLNGSRAWMSFEHFTKDEVLKWVEAMSNSGNFRDDITILSKISTQNPSIQGVWTPFTHKDPKVNVTQFPDKQLYEYKPKEKSATQQVLELYKKQHEKE